MEVDKSAMCPLCDERIGVLPLGTSILVCEICFQEYNGPATVVSLPPDGVNEAYANQLGKRAIQLVKSIASAYKAHTAYEPSVDYGILDECVRFSDMLDSLGFGANED